MTTNEELIADLLAYAGNSEGSVYAPAELFRVTAKALAATVQQDTDGDDREAMLALIVAHDPDDHHPDDQRRCICGATIGTSDGTIVTTDPYGHLVDIFLLAGFARRSQQEAPLRARIETLVNNQRSWIDAGRSGQVISRDAVRDSLQRALDETGSSSQQEAPTGEVEYAVQSRTFVGGEWDRLDDGTGWSHREGRKYTQHEAENNVRDPNRDRVVSRTVTPWLPVPDKGQEAGRG